MKLVRNKPPGKVRMTLTSLIDIIFLLIVFFMTVSNFSAEVTEPLDLPHSQRGASPGDDVERRIIVNVRSDGSIVVRRQEYSAEELSDMLKSEAARIGHDQVVVVLRLDREGNMGMMKRVLAQISSNGIWNVKISVTPE